MQSKPIAFVLVLAACSSSETSAGLAIVDTAAYACVPVLVPGADDIGTIDNFAPGPDGLMAWTSGETNLFIGTAADQSTPVGRGGEGPGEFAWVEQIGWSGDTLWASDMMLARVQYFDRDGALLSGHRLPPGAGWRRVRDGRFLAIASKPIGAPGWSVLQAHVSSEVPTADTLYHFPGPEQPTIHIPMAGGASMMTSDPFAPSAQAIAASDGSRFCGSEPLDGDQVRIRCIDDRGAIIRDTVITLAPEPLSDALWNRTIDRFARRAPENRAAIEGLFTRPSSLPRVTAVGVDRDGSLWLHRSHMSDSVQRWLRLDTAGAVRDTLLLRGGYIAYLSGDTLWRHRSDHDGMQSVERCVAR